MDPDSSNGICDVPRNTDPKYEVQNGDRTVSLGEQKTAIAGDEYLDLGHYHQKVGSWQETTHILEDGVKSMTKAENGRRDLWAPSADRESKLEVVKTGPLYDIRAYKWEKKPSRLYEEEEEGELHYELPPENLSPEKAKELEEERKEIIKSQVVKKSTTIAEKVTSVENLEAPSPASPGGEKTKSKRGDSMGFGLCFDKPSPGWVKTVIDPENIDTEQINFAAARQQFLALEKSNPNLLLGPRKQVMSPRMPASQNIYEREWEGCPAVLKDDGPNQRESNLSSKKAAPVSLQRARPVSEGRAVVYQDFPRENLDLGETGCDLRTEAHNGRLPQKKPGTSLDPVASGQDPAEELEARDETPIEREIRLSMEREENLWRERGIPRVNSRDELVEIRSKPLLSPPLSALASSTKRKDQARVSFYVQREIKQETKREEDLQREGRLPGAYDKGTPQMLRERRKVFESEGDPLLPSAGKPKHPGEGQESTPELPAHPHVANDEERIARQDMNQSSAVAQLRSALHTRTGNEPSQSRQGHSPGPKLLSMQETPEPDGQLVLGKGHFGLPTRRPTLTFPDDPRARRTEGRPQWAAPREEPYTLKTGKPRTSLLIDQEIQEALQREEELQEQRRKGRLARGGDAEKDFCSHLQPQSSGRFPSESDSKTHHGPKQSPFPSESDSKTHHGPKQSPTEEVKKRRQREEGKYAGIEPMDAIDTEVVNSTKVVRHRGTRAQLWEAGQILKRGEDSDP